MARHDGPMAYVADVVVTSDLRRRGIGTLLMRHAERWARDRGAVTITLNVHSGNSAALALYEQEGFRRTQITMRRDLT
ncbi:GNAT family N-acetyltransferase [Actinopolymorpha rutila]